MVCKIYEIGVDPCMTGYIVLGIVIMLAVLLLTLLAINKGYAFKHSIDELPEEDNADESQSQSGNW